MQASRLEVFTHTHTHTNPAVQQVSSHTHTRTHTLLSSSALTFSLTHTHTPCCPARFSHTHTYPAVQQVSLQPCPVASFRPVRTSSKQFLSAAHLGGKNVVKKYADSNPQQNILSRRDRGLTIFLHWLCSAPLLVHCLPPGPVASEV